jgi:hypothetical protein
VVRSGDFRILILGEQNGDRDILATEGVVHVTSCASDTTDRPADQHVLLDRSSGTAVVSVGRNRFGTTRRHCGTG